MAQQRPCRTETKAYGDSSDVLHCNSGFPYIRGTRGSSYEEDSYFTHRHWSVFFVASREPVESQSTGPRLGRSLEPVVHHVQLKEQLVTPL